MIVLVAFGLTPPTGSIGISETGGLRVDLELTEALQTYYRDTKALLHSIMRRNGCRPLTVDFVNKRGVPHENIHFATAHQVGSCRMADNRQDGVCDAAGEVFGYPGLFITDGAAIPTSLAVNTSLTILANAERIVAGIVERLRPSMQVVVAAASARDRTPQAASNHTIDDLVRKDA